MAEPSDLLMDIEDAPPPVEPQRTGPKPMSERFPDATPDAPYGFKPDGTPRIRPGRPVGWRKDGGSYSASTPRAPRRGGTPSLETQIGAFIVTVNAPLMLFLPQDALDAVEVQALSSAIDLECQRSPRFRKYVVQALAVQGGTSLILVVAAIAGRRVIRHNLVEIPEPVGNVKADAALGSVLSMLTGKGPINPNIATMPTEAVTSANG